MDLPLPFRAEYAETNIYNCRFCSKSFFEGVLLLGVMSQSPFYDGRRANWFHMNCFFKKHKVTTTDDIENFESLRIDDQDKIQNHVTNATILIPLEKGQKRPAEEKQSKTYDYLIENARSGRSTCRGCKQKILKNDVRVSKKNYDSVISQNIGCIDEWYHLLCFAELRSELGYLESADQIPGFVFLNKTDQGAAEEAIPAVTQKSVSASKKIKLEKDPLDKEYREQNKVMFEYRDKLKHVCKEDLESLLRYNNQQVPERLNMLLDRLSDIMTFGSLAFCPECKKGQFVFNKMGYFCTGNLNEWVKCTNVTKDPERRKFIIPDNLTYAYDFLRSYNYVPRKRVIKEVNPSVPITKDIRAQDRPKVARELPAFYDMCFVILGNPSQGKDVLKKKIESLGGKVITKISECMAVIADIETVEKHGARVRAAEAEQVHIVSEHFVDEAKDFVGKIPELILLQSICSWGSDPTARLPQASKTLKSNSRIGSIPSKIKLKLKGGHTVDRESGLVDVAHVFKDKYNENWAVVLGLTNVQMNKNSFYKLQILEADRGSRYWLYRSWGRIGTTIGSHDVKQIPSLNEAQEKFKKLYFSLTGNHWINRRNFVKVPDKMYHIEIDYGGDALDNLGIVEAESKLPKQVQDLMKLIFDINQMKQVMLEFELDTEKMPLGKISNSQIQEAYNVLSELQDLVENEAPDIKFIEATNRFYSLIPHNFGLNEVTILRDKDAIKQKLDMLDSLLEMEIACNLMKSSDGNNTVDAYYLQLKIEIDVLQSDTEEYKIINEYLKNTHAKTHTGYELIIEDIFMINRGSENERFKKLHNRKLLWHGSRTTNYAGILSQGLKIAPPGAPVTGYMFGKGIYFADMVSKSANYCCPNRISQSGLLLLCDVALGNMLEKQQAADIRKPPKGYHSVKGVGRTRPDPSIVKYIDGAEVPTGKGVEAPRTERNILLYNEYIVYDVAQIRIRYLLKVKFNYNK